jgi:hypothetical protein
LGYPIELDDLINKNKLINVKSDHIRLKNEHTDSNINKVKSLLITNDLYIYMLQHINKTIFIDYIDKDKKYISMNLNKINEIEKKLNEYEELMKKDSLIKEEKIRLNKLKHEYDPLKTKIKIIYMFSLLFSTINKYIDVLKSIMNRKINGLLNYKTGFKKLFDNFCFYSNINEIKKSNKFSDTMIQTLEVIYSEILYCNCFDGYMITNDYGKIHKSNGFFMVYALNQREPKWNIFPGCYDSINLIDNIDDLSSFIYNVSAFDKYLYDIDQEHKKKLH